MKKTTIFCTLFLVALAVSAQKYTHSLQGVEWVKIESSADIIVKKHSSNELLIEGGEKHKRPERAKGLKLVGEDGTDNTDVGFYVIKEGNNLIVKNLKKGRTAKIFLPDSKDISVITNWQGSIEIDGFKGEIEATAKLNGGIKINDVSGPLTVNSLNGGISISFSQVSQASPITVYSTNGALDIDLPEQTKADLNLGTTNGAIYTNFELEIPEKKGLKPIATKKVKGEINNGGVSIQLKTTNGDIYLRKH